jgi:hypothetical protein
MPGAAGDEPPIGGTHEVDREVLTMRIARAIALVITTSVVAAGAALPAAAADSSPPGVSPIKLWTIDEVSHTGRWVAGQGTTVDGVAIIDRKTGSVTGEPADGPRWFIRDNPVLRLNRDHVAEYPNAAVFLKNVATGVRKRIDTDSKGAPLKPTWAVKPGYDDQYDSYYATPQLLISAESVSRNGRRAAFCANYQAPKKPILYVKDLRTGRLTRTGIRCGVSYEETTRLIRAPQMSEDGRVVHVNGNTYNVPRDMPTSHWLGDTLYFTGSGKVRAINGFGSMTRDGGTILMRVGVRPEGSADTTGGRVGAYNIRTAKIRVLPGSATIYGNDVFTFSAFDQASRRGRFVVNDTSVIDRTYGITVDISALLRTKGYTIPPDEAAQCGTTRSISGDGKVVIAHAGVSAKGGCNTDYLAVTGWEPKVGVALVANADRSKLVVNVDPDKGSGHWTFRVQRQRANKTWTTLRRTYRTQGAAETRTVNLPAGTYRVRINARYGYGVTTSTPVTLVR